ncbi:MAG TPA: CehA/McbA family metallohydrolase [Candidatus Methylomirabilis sp.]|nr:CehA/McbA family metallohydrolase [Candidatus Methylomirabilis sp.]
MKIRNPYRKLPQWFRGNLHTHSRLSDGEWPLERVVAFYRDRGYAFLAVTDHDVFTDVTRFTTPDFLALTSDEVTVCGRDHIVGLGLHGPVKGLADHQSTIRAITDQGGLAILAHPNWSSLTLERCLGLNGYSAIEIYNVECQHAEYNGYALQFWDGLLRRGVRVWGIAADDAHRVPYQGAKAWIVVDAESLAAGDILQSIRTGNFYSTSGPHFQGFEVEGDTIRVWCSPTIEIRFLTGERNPALCLRGEGLTSGTYAPRPGDAYVRVEVVDAQMQSAWSQPFFIDPDWRP